MTHGEAEPTRGAARRVWEGTDPHARLTRRSQVATVRECTFGKAQPHTNFVVLAPGRLPDDCNIETVTLRPEQPPGRPGVEAEEIGQAPWTIANPCSVRAVIAGRGRRLRLKEFLYDWAPPAASTPSLWRSPHLDPFPCQGAIGWLGVDYRKRAGASVQLARTQVELSVAEGAFSERELRDVLRHLTVAAAEESAAVRGAPFHVLNYWVRYRMRGPRVPHGLWDCHEARRYDRARHATRDDPHVAVPPPFRLDSAILIEDPEQNHRELELVCRHEANGNDAVWISVSHADSAGALRLPPRASSHPAAVRQPVEWRGTRVWYAALDPNVGAWEAMWQEGEVRVAVWANSSSELGGEGFRAVVEELEIPRALV